ncbi:hypothetical protein R6Q59_035244 [Mikania micrantha]
MGSCFSKKTSSTALSPEPQDSDLKSGHQPANNTRNDQQAFKKEIFVIKHRPSHEIDRHSDQESENNPSAITGVRLRTSGCSKEDDCDRLSRCNSAGAQNTTRRRRYSRSKGSFDLGPNSNVNSNNDDDGDVGDDEDDDALNHHHRNRHRQPEIRVSSSRQSSSRERRISISPSRRSSSKDRRISISPSRRSESPFGSSVAASGSSSSRPAKMISVPATDKSNNAGVQQAVVGPVKRIHVKRNVSPARSNLRVFSDNQSKDQESSSREADHRRRSLVEIDNNAARCAHMRDTKRTRKLSRDLDMNPETIFEPSLGAGPGPGSGSGSGSSPPSYASLLLEDIHNFHKKNASVSTTPPAFALPECVNKACLIMEAVADLNANTGSLCLDDRWRNQTTIRNDSSGMAVNGLT